MDYELSIQNYLKNLGYCVEKIAEGNEESPDFLIFDTASAYLLELKTKFPSDLQLEEKRRSLVYGGIYNVRESIIPKNTLSGIIKKAKNQLEMSNHDQELLKIVWLLSTGDLAEPRMYQFEATLYGSTPVLDLSTPRNHCICYFFYNSDFYRFRDVLDAAIVSTESKPTLLLNPFSPSYLKMKNSSLPKHLGSAIVDPIELEREGKCFIVDGDVDRNNEEEVLQYLREKYFSKNIIHLPLNYLSGTTIIPGSI